ncbi:hypothetical protein QEN19_002650 [Hanseniaspora menglaensis]
MAKKNNKKVEPIVAENSKKGKKNGKNTGAVEEEPSAAEIKLQQKQKRQENVSKVTSSSSWTGKLPHTLLYEKCQKNKWGKVEYDMFKTDDGFIAAAVLQATINNEKLICKMGDPIYRYTNCADKCIIPQETPLEARNVAATVALYRICYNTNMKMMLPPNVHRQIWEKLEEFRKKLLKDDKYSCDKFFDIDPFKSLLEKRRIDAQKEKEKKAKAEQEMKNKIQPMVVMDSLGTTTDTHTSQKDGKFNEMSRKIARLSSEIHEVDDLISFPTKVWEKAPVIDFSNKKRLDLERVIQPLYYETITKRNLPTLEKLVKEKELLLTLGFKETHVLESLQYDDPLSFLIFLTPAQDLPAFFTKKREDSKTTITIRKLEYSKQIKVEKLMELGILEEEAAQVLLINDWNEAKACSYLTKRAIDPPLEDNIGSEDDDMESFGSSEEIWNMEIESLKSIYNDDVELINDSTCLLTLNAQLKMKVYKTETYPNEMPGVIISTFDPKFHLPTYTKKEIITKLVSHIKDTGLLGGMMLYELFDFISQNINEIIKNPSPLLEQIKKKNGLRTNDEFDKNAKSKIDNNSNGKKKKRNQFKLSDLQIKQLKEDYENRYKTLDYQAFKKYRMNLPVSKRRDEILNMINSNQKTLITAGTGCGKSTQVPQFMLEDLIEKEDYNRRILVTQPRRIAAIGLAERVSQERCSTLGDEVGYVIRGVNKTSAKTRLTFMTTGILVRMLQGDLEILDNTTIVIDEVHERSIETDLIIILLKRVMKMMKNSTLKVVLMSATVDEDQYKKFFDNDLATAYVEGRTFPVTDYFLEDVISMVNFQIKSSFDNKNNKKSNSLPLRTNFSKLDSAYDDVDEDRYFDSLQDEENGVLSSSTSLARHDSHFFKTGQISYDLITQVVEHIDDELTSEKSDGSIIIFLPGVGEIDSCCRSLRNLGSSFEILPLHSALAPDEQKKVFNSYKNKRKVVVATNIAETSITIDDVVATVDCGRAKTVFYSSKDNTTKLLEGWISKAESKQRRGRAGRVRSGKCYKLFSSETYKEMKDYPIPEIKRVGLQDLYLNIKAMNIDDVVSFLKESMDAPSTTNVKKAERHLKEKGLLTESNELTKMGKYISLLPGSDTDGKILINSILFRCVDTGILLASIIGLSDLPFIGGIDNRDKIKSLIKNFRGETNGDLIATLRIVQGYYNSSQKSSYMREHCLSFMKLKEISSSCAQFKSWLRDLGFLPLDYKEGDKRFNENSQNFNIVKSIITGSLYPNIARVQYPDTKYAMTSSGAVEKDVDATSIKYWVRNEEYMEHIYQNQGKPKEEQVTMNKKGALIDNTINKPLPAKSSFAHPSSTFHERKNAPPEIDIETGELAKKKRAYKPNFVLYTSSSESVFKDFKGKDYSKLFLRTIEPTSTVSVLLFGGSFDFDLNLSNKTSGIVVDNWMPIRVWCKNGVLIKELKYLLDEATHLILSSPLYSSKTIKDPQVERAFEILKIVEKVIENENYY